MYHTTNIKQNVQIKQTISTKVRFVRLFKIIPNNGKN
jgi:hypothetical protein